MIHVHLLFSSSSPRTGDQLNHRAQSTPQCQPSPNTQHIIRRRLNFVLCKNFPILYCCTTANTTILCYTFVHRILKNHICTAPSNPLTLSPSPYILCWNRLLFNSDDPAQFSSNQKFYHCSTVHPGIISNCDNIRRHYLNTVSSLH